jgi:glycerol-3-phosphate dehydrogenase (NAD(P)+)
MIHLALRSIAEQITGAAWRRAIRRRRQPTAGNKPVGNSGREGEHFMQIRSLGIAGAGAWGTALTIQAVRAGLATTLWARRPEAAAAIAASRANPDYLPDATLPEEVAVTAQLTAALAADAILYVQPSQHLRAFCTAARGAWRAGTPLVLCAKGIELGSGLLLTDVAAELLPEAPVAVLSGPSFASEVAAGLPTAVVIASADAALNEALMQALSHWRLPALRQPGPRRRGAGRRRQERARDRLAAS